MENCAKWVSMWVLLAGLAACGQEDAASVGQPAEGAARESVEGGGSAMSDALESAGQVRDGVVEEVKSRAGEVLSGAKAKAVSEAQDKAKGVLQGAMGGLTAGGAVQGSEEGAAQAAENATDSAEASRAGMRDAAGSRFQELVDEAGSQQP